MTIDSILYELVPDLLDLSHDRGKSRAGLRSFGTARIAPDDFPPTRAIVVKLPLVAIKSKPDTLPVVAIKPANSSESN